MFMANNSQLITQDVACSGASLHCAKAAVIVIHGRDSSPDDVLSLTTLFAQPDIAYLAPRAVSHQWYPHPYLSPIEENEPHITLSIAMLNQLIKNIETENNVPIQRIALFGFSQGACLALELAVRCPRRYGAIIGLSGALFRSKTSRNASGSLEGTPVFLGCSAADPHIPLSFVHDSAEKLSALDAAVTKEIYPGSSHAIVTDEIRITRKMLANLIDRQTK